MTAITIDTYKLVANLKTRGFTEEQAIGVTEAIQEIDLSEMATKGDLITLKSDLKAEFADFRAEIFKWAVPMLIGQAGFIVLVLKFLG